MGHRWPPPPPPPLGDRGGGIPGLECSSEGECKGGMVGNVVMNGSVFVNGKKIFHSKKESVTLDCVQYRSQAVVTCFGVVRLAEF